MTASEANYQRVTALYLAEHEQMLQVIANDKISPAVRRGILPMPQLRRLSFYDRRDRIVLNDL